MKDMNFENSGLSEPFIGKAEVARRLKKSLRTIDHWIKLGILPYYKINRSILFKWSDIEACLEKSCRVRTMQPNTDVHINELEANDKLP